MAAVVSVRDESVPRSFEVRGLVIAARGRAEETNCRAIRIAGYGCWEYCVLDPRAGADIDRRAPGKSAIFADRDERVIVRWTSTRNRSGPGEINRIRNSRRNWRVLADGY